MFAWYALKENGVVGNYNPATMGEYSIVIFTQLDQFDNFDNLIFMNAVTLLSLRLL